jgi:hypothetical protein
MSYTLDSSRSTLKFRREFGSSFDVSEYFDPAETVTLTVGDVAIAWNGKADYAGAIVLQSENRTAWDKDDAPQAMTVHGDDLHDLTAAVEALGNLLKARARKSCGRVAA